MWNMYYDINTACDECGFFSEQPPKFMLPPPPRPPTLVEYSFKKCNEEKVLSKNYDGWSISLCDTIPIHDSNIDSSQSLQMQTMIAVLSLVIVLVTLISSLFLWKNKQKLQLLIQLKTQNTHTNSGLALRNFIPYQDPDSYFRQVQPLVFQQNNSLKMFHYKNVNFTRDYPTVHSQLFLKPNSLDRDTYSSDNNVYEELTKKCDSDVETEAHSQSDADFVADDLSLRKEGSYNSCRTTNETTVSTTYCNPYRIKESLANNTYIRSLNSQTNFASLSSSNKQTNSSTSYSKHNSYMENTPMRVSFAHSKNDGLTLNVAVHNQPFRVKDKAASTLSQTKDHISNRILPGLTFTQLEMHHTVPQSQYCYTSCYKNDPCSIFIERSNISEIPLYNYTEPIQEHSFNKLMIESDLSEDSNFNFRNYLGSTSAIITHKETYDSSCGSDSGYSHHTLPFSIDQNDVKVLITEKNNFKSKKTFACPQTKELNESD